MEDKKNLSEMSVPINQLTRRHNPQNLSIHNGNTQHRQNRTLYFIPTLWAAVAEIALRPLLKAHKINT
jgi:hypothetical protein